MTSGGSWLIAIGLAWLIAEVLFGNSKKISWFPVHAWVRVQKSRRGTTYSVTRPAKRRKTAARKRKK